MKTAISLPDPLFEAAEALAERLGVSRSELHARALARFVEQQARSDVTARLDAVHGAEPEAPEEREERRQLAALQARSLAPSLGRDAW